jgi:hypothetical protein
MELKKLQKLAASYFVPAIVFAAPLCSAFFSEIGLLEKLVVGDNTIRQIISPSSAQTRTPDGNPPGIDDKTGLWSNNSHRAGDEDSLRTAQLTPKLCFNQTTFSNVQKNTKELRKIE